MTAYWKQESRQRVGFVESRLLLGRRCDDSYTAHFHNAEHHLPFADHPSKSFEPRRKTLPIGPLVPSETVRALNLEIFTVCLP